MVELVDTRDLKSRGPGRVRAGSSPAPGIVFRQLGPAHFKEFKTTVSHHCHLSVNYAFLARSMITTLRAFSCCSFK